MRRPGHREKFQRQENRELRRRKRQADQAHQAVRQHRHGGHRKSYRCMPDLPSDPCAVDGTLQQHPHALGLALAVDKNPAAAAGQKAMSALTERPSSNWSPVTPQSARMEWKERKPTRIVSDVTGAVTRSAWQAVCRHFVRHASPAGSSSDRDADRFRPRRPGLYVHSWRHARGRAIGNPVVDSLRHGRDPKAKLNPDFVIAMTCPSRFAICRDFA